MWEDTPLTPYAIDALKGGFVYVVLLGISFATVPGAAGLLTAAFIVYVFTYLRAKHATDPTPLDRASTAPIPRELRALDEWNKRKEAGK